MSKRALYTLVGFILFMLGVVALLLEMVGLSFGFMAIFDIFGRLGAFIAKLTMIFGGLVLVVLANGNEDETDEYLEGE